MNAALQESFYDSWGLGGLELAAQGAHSLKRQLIMDLETSALTPEKRDIIRFYAVNRWCPDHEFNEWVKRPRSMSAEAERASGTTNERLAHCRPCMSHSQTFSILSMAQSWSVIGWSSILPS